MPRQSMRGAAQRGRDAEVECAQLLQTDGWVVGSRRHIPGPGDLLAVKLTGAEDFAPENRHHLVWLIEVKTTSRPYERFGPDLRHEMSEMARRLGARAMLAYKPQRTREWEWIPEDAWPA
jgi:Holliday junction resolvase